VTASPATATETITTPSAVGAEVNIRLREDDDPLVEADSTGGKTNGEVEDYQATVSLPVELSMFRGTVDGCNTQLNWRAETEEAFSHYELEWSGDGYNFQMIERLEGAGSLTASQAYQYYDEFASVENYYRLRMVDIDGSIEYSDIVVLETDCDDENDMVVYPNPLSVNNGVVKVKFYSNRDETVLIVVDLLGQIVRRLSLGVDQEWNTVNIDITDLPVGTYFIKQVGSKGSKRFVMQE